MGTVFLVQSVVPEEHLLHRSMTESEEDDVSEGRRVTSFGFNRVVDLYAPAKESRPLMRGQFQVWILPREHHGEMGPGCVSVLLCRHTTYKYVYT